MGIFISIASKQCMGGNTHRRGQQGGSRSASFRQGAGPETREAGCGWGRGPGRPRIARRVSLDLGADYFKPAGVSMTELEMVSLTLEETEALRLSDLEDLEQEEAAGDMGVSRRTFWRELQSARKKVADALINGKAIQIQKETKMPRGDGTGPNGKGPRTGRGMGNCPPQTGDATGSMPGRGLGLGRGLGRGRGRQSQ